MKIRIKGNSIRYRLSKTEVENFSREGYVIERTEFKDQIFNYELRSHNLISNLDADFKNDTISMYLPEKDKNDWATSDRVGFQYSITLGNGKELFLLLEKDFVCLDETIEDQSDNYPNPLMAKRK
ncbi:hypothetical protein DHD05_16055 [Arenibacter sp. N53]|uniref:DUF7009 family protein n=1 Tax=Arenibacter TaxID=178469 RepID=UPI000CD4252F|nr:MULTISPECIES: hypothetical protein [Arenibacter]MCM4153105.1 hypothetical protein [Arenibacter sp. N53]